MAGDLILSVPLFCLRVFLCRLRPRWSPQTLFYRAMVRSEKPFSCTIPPQNVSLWLRSWIDAGSAGAFSRLCTRPRHVTRFNIESKSKPRRVGKYGKPLWRMCVSGGWRVDWGGRIQANGHDISSRVLPYHSSLALSLPSPVLISTVFRSVMLFPRFLGTLKHET